MVHCDIIERFVRPFPSFAVGFRDHCRIFYKQRLKKLQSRELFKYFHRVWRWWSEWRL